MIKGNIGRPPCRHNTKGMYDRPSMTSIISPGAQSSLNPSSPASLSPLQGLPVCFPPAWNTSALLTFWLAFPMPQVPATASLPSPERLSPQPTQCSSWDSSSNAGFCFSRNSTYQNVYISFSCSIYVLIPWLPYRGQCQDVKNHFCFVHHFIPSPVTVTKLSVHLLKELGRTEETPQSKGQWRALCWRPSQTALGWAQHLHFLSSTADWDAQCPIESGTNLTFSWQK